MAAEANQEAGAASERARDGLEHLQAAARELIQAARAMLDVAEQLVNDPDTVASVVGTLGGLATAASKMAGGDAPNAERSGDRVQRIKVS